MNTKPNRWDTLFALIPDDVILRMATRELVLSNPDSCLVGWAVREGVAEMINVDADAFDIYDPRVQKVAPTPYRSDFCFAVRTVQKMYGGRNLDWEALFVGVTKDKLLPAIETAFVNRILQTV